MSAGGAPNVGLPIRLTDRVLGLGLVASERTADPGGIVARADGGGAANWGGREVGVGPSTDGPAGAAVTAGRGGAGGTDAVCGGAGRTAGAAGATAGALATGGAADGGGGGGGTATELCLLIVSSEYRAFARSDVSCSASRLRSSSVGAAGRSGTEARLGNALLSPGLVCGALASLGAADSGSSSPIIASVAPSYHSTGLAQSGTGEQPASITAHRKNAPARAKLDFCGDSELSARSKPILIMSLYLNTNFVHTIRSRTNLQYCAVQQFRVDLLQY